MANITALHVKGAINSDQPLARFITIDLIFTENREKMQIKYLPIIATSTSLIGFALSLMVFTDENLKIQAAEKYRSHLILKKGLSITDYPFDAFVTAYQQEAFTPMVSVPAWNFFFQLGSLVCSIVMKVSSISIV